MSTPVDEFARQRALDSYRIVDTLPEQAYDDIVQLASTLCDTPMALVTLIDRDRQWFKSRLGLDDEQTDRKIAMCDHAIREPDRLMEVRDASVDPRFADFPHVAGAPHVRFYAGMPLVTPGGAAVGTVCVIDSEPRELDEKQRAGLAALARLAINLMEARQRELELERNARLAGIENEPEPPARVGDGFAVGVIEVQDVSGTTRRLGERAFKRALEDLEHALEAGLRPGIGDSVSHAANSGEFIVVMHGDDCSDPWATLRGVVARFEAESGIALVSAAAEAEYPDQSLAEVFLMADEALSREKDAALAA
jgi:GAF domain-containing protein